MTTLVNPKDVEAQKLGKAPLEYLEPIADRQIAWAMKYGGDKYGIRNYTISPISARVYVGAMRRHLADWSEGEDIASDSGLHHLAHVGANVHVVLKAIHVAKFIDDRDLAETL